MSTNIFNRKVEYAGTFTTDSAVVRFSGAGGGGSGGNQDSLSSTGLIVSSINVQYQQNIDTLWTLTGSKGYLVVGRPDGQCTLQGVVADGGTMKNFLQTFGDACRADNVISISSTMAACGTRDGIGNSIGTSYSIKNATITTIGFQVSIENLMLMSSVTLRFLGLTM